MRRRILIVVLLLTLAIALVNIGCPALAPAPTPATAPKPTPTPAPSPTVAPTPPASSEAVSFPDANLEAAIRWRIRKPQGFIYKADLKSLTILRAPNSSITNLTGLEHCTNLHHLDLNNNQISDVSALARLANLQLLFLSRNQIKDISPITMLNYLKNVSLNNNPLSFVSSNIYIVQLEIRGVSVEQNSLIILPTITLLIALSLIAIYMQRITNWGLARRFLQLAVIILISGFAYYLGIKIHMVQLTLPISIFASILVGFAVIVTFWSFRGWILNLVAFALIALWIVYLATMWVFYQVRFVDEFNFYFIPCLVATGVFFLLRRVRLAIAIIVSLVVLLACGFALFVLAMTGTG